MLHFECNFYDMYDLFKEWITYFFYLYTRRDLFSTWLPGTPYSTSVIFWTKVAYKVGASRLRIRISCGVNFYANLVFVHHNSICKHYKLKRKSVYMPKINHEVDEQMQRCEINLIFLFCSEPQTVFLVGFWLVIVLLSFQSSHSVHWKGIVTKTHWFLFYIFKSLHKRICPLMQSVRQRVQCSEARLKLPCAVVRTVTILTLSLLLFLCRSPSLFLLSHSLMWHVEQHDWICA